MLKGCKIKNYFMFPPYLITVRKKCNAIFNKQKCFFFNYYYSFVIK